MVPLDWMNNDHAAHGARARGNPRRLPSAAALRGTLLLALLASLACASTRDAADGPEPAASASTTARPADQKAPFDDIRGITVSCGWHSAWANPSMKEFLGSVPEVSANWVTIHPYAKVSKETGEVDWLPEEGTEYIVRPIRWAHEAGLKIMVKPHLAYWGQFSWRGEVGWGPDENNAAWQRFRATNREWILRIAAICAAEGADLFVVGTELRLAEHMEDYWKGLIRDVRTVYDGPLTYAANWDDFHEVPFWSHLDYVGVQAYFPLSNAGNPSVDELRSAWARHAATMKRVGRAVGKPVLLTEVGYSNTATAASRPWEPEGPPEPDGLQARCLRVALETVRDDPGIAGAFIWKWFPTLRSIGPGDFTVQTDEFKALLREIWSASDSAEGTRALRP
ncbi:MAG: hypothetical protein AAF533_09030 [Acidobacteriota bacterium]